MGGYFSYFWPAPEQNEHPAHTDGKELYWWETTVDNRPKSPLDKKSIGGWCRYKPEELIEFHKADKYSMLLENSTFVARSSYVTFMKVDFDRLLELAVEHSKRNIIDEFKCHPIQEIVV